MYSLFLLAALAQPAPEAAVAGGLPPEQALASIDAKGNVTITHISCICFPTGAQEAFAPALPPGVKAEEKAKPKAKVRVSTLTVTTAEVASKDIQAYTADGRPVAPEKLAELLSRERSVLVAVEGKKVDPFHLQLYKDDTLVLVPPANTITPGMGGIGGYAVWGASNTYGGPVPIAVPTPAVEVAPVERIKPAPEKPKD